MNIKELIKNTEIWKIGVMICLLIVILFGGYNITTKWGSITKTDREMTKIKAQTNYSKDMKINMTYDICNHYEDTLKAYIKDNNLIVTDKEIRGDIKYYRMMISTINDACEDITIDRYIHNNDLYRYQNKNDWNVFKQNVIALYIRTGRELLRNFYDDTKVIMPLKEWLKRGGKGIGEIVAKNADKLLEDLKIESCIFYKQGNGYK